MGGGVAVAYGLGVDDGLGVGLDGLVGGRRRRWGRTVVGAEQTAEEAGVFYGLLLGLLELLAGLGEGLVGGVEILFGLVELLFGVVERVLLDEDGLRHDVQRVGVLAEVLEDELFGFRILVGELGLVDAVGQALEQIVLLRCHFVPSMVSSSMTLGCCFGMYAGSGPMVQKQETRASAP